MSTIKDMQSKFFYKHMHENQVLSWKHYIGGQYIEQIVFESI